MPTDGLGRPFALLEYPGTRQWAVVLRVVPEGGALPPEEELEAMEAAEQAEQQPPPEEKHELDLDELDAAALAQEAELTASGELQPSRADVEGELSDDEFDRAVDAGTADGQQQP